MDVYFFVNTIVILLHCVYLMQNLHYTGHVQISNDAKLNMADGAHKDL
jgi:hypothetical protein